VYKEIELTIAPEKKLSFKDVCKVANEYSLFAPTIEWDDTPAAIAEDDEDEPFLDRQPINTIQQKQQEKMKEPIRRTLAPTKDDMSINTPFRDTHTLVRAISKLQHPNLWPPDTTPQMYEEADIITELKERLIYAIQLKDTTHEEQALGSFTHKKLKTLPIRDLLLKAAKGKPNNSTNLKTYKYLENRYSSINQANLSF